MLRGEVVGLRARQESDVLVLHTGLYEDVATQVRSSAVPWRPAPPDPASSPYGMSKVTATDQHIAHFSVVRLSDDALVGSAAVWGIDLHNRLGHLGLSLLPAFRGKGLATDALHVLCRYGFAVRGLHRLQLETLTDNLPMIRAAERAGFAAEGTLRGSAWADGAFLDEVVLGLLDTEWAPPRSAEPAD